MVSATAQKCNPHIGHRWRRMRCHQVRTLSLHRKARSCLGPGPPPSPRRVTNCYIQTFTMLPVCEPASVFYLPASKNVWLKLSKVPEKGRESKGWAVVWRHGCGFITVGLENAFSAMWVCLDRDWQKTLERMFLPVRCFGASISRFVSKSFLFLFSNFLRKYNWSK